MCEWLKHMRKTHFPSFHLFKFVGEVMANLTKRQTYSHSLNRGFCDLAHRFVNAHTLAHTPSSNKHNK